MPTTFSNVTREEMAAHKQRLWDEQQKSRGIGDTIAKMTSAVGIRPCGGCKQRQAWLNKKFPYKDSTATQPSDS